MSETPYKRLEPASLAINLLPDLWRTVRSGWPLLILAAGGSRGLIDFGFFLLFLGLSVSRTVLHFITVKYRLHAGRLEIESGLFGRRSRIIDPARIQNIELVQNVFHRAFGLVELRIETAGESGADGMLSALSVIEAERLRGALRSEAPQTREEVEELERTGIVEVLGYGVTEGRVGAAIVVYAVAQEWGAQIQPELFSTILARPGASAVLLVVFLALGYAWSVVSSFVRYYGFTLSRTPVGLRTESGLFTKRRVEIPSGKVQQLRVDETLLRRLMGYATVGVETAGSGTGGPAEAVVPMLPVDVLAETLEGILPGYAASEAEPWRPPAPAALRRMALQATLNWVGLLTLLGFFAAPAVGAGTYPWLGLGALVLGPLLGWRRWRMAGWKLGTGVVAVRQGVLARRTVVAPRSKVQSVHLVQGPVQRRFGLWQVEVWVAGGRLETPELDEHDARTMFGALGGEP